MNESVNDFSWCVADGFLIMLSILDRGNINITSCTLNSIEPLKSQDNVFNFQTFQSISLDSLKCK